MGIISLNLKLEHSTIFNAWKNQNFEISLPNRVKIMAREFDTQIQQGYAQYNLRQ